MTTAFFSSILNNTVILLLKGFVGVNQKRSLFRRFSDLVSDSSPLMTAVGRLMLLIVLNLCWLVCSLPLITAGAAATALWAVLLERDEHSYLSAIPAFFRAFRRYLKSATLLWLPYLAIGAVLLLDFALLMQRNALNNAMLLMPLLLSSALWGMTQLWLYPLLALDDTLSPAAAVRAAFITALRELWRSLAGLAVSVIPVVIFLLYGKLFIQLLPLWILLGAALPARLILFLTEPILRT